MNKTNRKKCELLKLIIKNNCIDIFHIKNILKMSSPSIHRFIFEINEDLNEIFPESNVSICFARNGYALQSNKFQKSYLLDSLKLFYIKQSNEFIVLDALISKHYSSINQLSLKTNISSSHLYKYIKKIRNFLSKYKLDIHFKSKRTTNCSLIGIEIHKLYFLNIYYWKIYKGIDYLNVIPCEASLYKISSLSYHKKIRTQQILAVSRHFGVQTCSHQIDPELKAICNVFSTFNQHLVNEQNIELSTLHITPLESYFMRLFIPEFDSDLNKLKIAKQTTLLRDNETVVLSTTFLNSLFETYKVKPNTFQYNICFYYSLIIHIFLKYINIDLFHSFVPFDRLSDLSTNELSFVELEIDLLHFLKELTTTNKNYSLQLSKINRSYMVNFSYFLLDYCTKSKKVFIYVELTQNIFSEQTIKKNLISIFGNENIELTNFQTKADIILTDVYQEEVDAEKIYYFDTLYSHDSWTNVLSFITAIIYKKKSSINLNCN